MSRRFYFVRGDARSFWAAGLLLGMRVARSLLPLLSPLTFPCPSLLGLLARQIGLCLLTPWNRFLR